MLWNHGLNPFHRQLLQQGIECIHLQGENGSAGPRLRAPETLRRVDAEVRRSDVHTIMHRKVAMLFPLELKPESVAVKLAQPLDVLGDQDDAAEAPRPGH